MRRLIDEVVNEGLMEVVIRTLLVRNKNINKNAINCKMKLTNKKEIREKTRRE